MTTATFAIAKAAPTQLDADLAAQRLHEAVEQRYSGRHDAMEPIRAHNFKAQAGVPLGFNGRQQAKAGFITTGILTVAALSFAFSQSATGQSLLEKAGLKKAAPITQNHTAVAKHTMPTYLSR